MNKNLFRIHQQYTSSSIVSGEFQYNFFMTSDYGRSRVRVRLFRDMTSLLVVASLFIRIKEPRVIEKGTINNTLWPFSNKYQPNGDTFIVQLFVHSAMGGNRGALSQQFEGRITEPQSERNVICYPHCIFNI